MIIDMQMLADVPFPANASEPLSANAGEPLPAVHIHVSQKGMPSGAQDFLFSSDPGLLEKWDEASPDRFIKSPFMMKPGRPDVEKLAQEYEAARLGGMGEIASQLGGIAPNEPWLSPYFVPRVTVPSTPRRPVDNHLDSYPPTCRWRLP
jgi:hypothetical protein